MKQFLVFCLYLSSFFANSLSLPAATLVVGWRDGSVQSLRFMDKEYLARGTFMLNTVDFAGPGGQPVPGSTQAKITAEANQHSQVLALDWGAIRIHYEDRQDSLGLTIEITNHGKLPLTQLSLDALAIQMPCTPAEYDGHTPILGTNVGAPTVLPLSCPGASVIVANDEPRKPLLIGMPWSLNAPAKTIFPIRINTGRDPKYPNSLPFIDRPIPPGATDIYRLSIRFQSGKPDILASARDVLKKFSGLNKFSLQWPDRRPIGSLILATANTHWAGNPRGWLLDPKIDVNTPEGLAEFHRRILAWADRSILVLRKMNAQGMITWDIEGEQFPHSTTYIGDPAAVNKLAPEMAAIVDEYFQRFRKAGMRVGVTIRPQMLDQTKNPPHQIDAHDPVAELSGKISFAKKRWGATLFYIDSNGDPIWPIDFDVIAKVAQAFPDVLLIPEHKNIAYYSRSAPYSESRSGYYRTPAFTTAIYPGAFSVINTADGQVEAHRAELQVAVDRGDILMFRGWFDDPANATLKAISAKSKFKPATH